MPKSAYAISPYRGTLVALVLFTVAPEVMLQEPLPLPAGDELAGYAFGETSGLRPQWRDPNGPKTEENYDPASVERLRQARKAICEVIRNRVRARRGAGAYRTTPTQEELQNPHTARIWELCRAAAGEAVTAPGLAQECQHFYIRAGTEREGESGPYRDRPTWAGNSLPTHSYGPFRNVGGGDVRRGDDIYVDVYCGIR